MKFRITNQAIITKKLFVWYIPAVLLLIHGFMLMNDIEFWENVVTPLLIIFSAISLIPILRKRTPNFMSVFFFMAGLFVFGIAESIWSVVEGVLHQMPSENVYLAYFYTLANVCFFAAAIAYMYTNQKCFNLIQLLQDLIASMLMGIGFIVMIYYDTQIFGKVEVGIENTSNFIFLLTNTLTLIILVGIGLSFRIKRLRWGGNIILSSLVIFFLADSFYVSEVTNNMYVPYGFLDWVYAFSLLFLSAGVKVAYNEFEEMSVCTIRMAKQNEGPIRHMWLLISIPILDFLLCGLRLNHVIYFASVIIIHIVLSLHIQKNIFSEKSLKTNLEVNELLRKKVEERTLQLRTMNTNLSYLLKHDNLTGLENRDSFFEQLDEILLKCRQNETVHLLILDVNHFRMVNELYGDSVGDKVLIEIAKRLESVCKEEYALARIYGDEFTIFWGGTDDKCRMKMLTENLCAAFSDSLVIEPFSIPINIHMGIASFPENAKNRVDLINCAKIALKQVKSSKTESYALYDETLHQQERRKQELELALRDSDFGRELKLYFQPEYEPTGTTLIGMEALLRWRSPALGLVGPVEFIPIAEETGLILEIGEWVMKTAMEQIRDWNKRYETEFFVGINISAVQLQNTGFVGLVRKLIEETGVNASQLNFEITESSTLNPNGAAVSILKQLSEMGISIAVDDFGTGYSSYGYIKRFSIDILKIDKQLIDTITTNPNDAQVVKAIIAMASALNIRTIAEGVETKEQARLLKKMNCDIIQGYLFGKPVPAEEFADLHLDKEECEIIA
ncbi:bifunctional diguanylate cyclase/phosphodiesterase [Parasporobacterium paucivorans]|uniref:Diguanylate cyclase (GGDEF) domain-containing protein n=1 Tax=Parasporobacterium paucivorans DSM 15970 TaxID=1122934 RepID=A0A1M6K179_9FIRM|nr:bifunctional diguanylate cyclase/phosphodiesterase [Parasporobacterium paucivorans]SHJ52741.1 diguanylate cyclase (GGDEF) domain-containing protein [Parasporobacterium paucivorans DSM 15970]